MIAGASVRFRLYSAWGLSAFEITKVVAFCTLTFWLGFFTIGGLTFIVEPMGVPEPFHLPFASVRPLGMFFLAQVVTYLCLKKQKETREKQRAPRKGKCQSVNNTIVHVEKGGRSYRLNGYGLKAPLCFLIAFILNNDLPGYRFQFFTDGHKMVFHDVSYIEVKPHVKKKAIAIELTDFSVFYSQDSVDHVAESLKNCKNKITVEQGQIVKVIKDKKGIVTREVLTWHWTDYWSVDFEPKLGIVKNRKQNIKEKIE